MFVDMSNKQYHSTPAISSSWLKLMNKSAAHLWHAYINPDRVPSVPTPAMQLGSLAHTLILEPEKLELEYVIVPEGIDRRSKDGKAFFAEIEKSGKTPIKDADYQHCVKMAEAMRNNVGFMELRRLKHENERTLFWDDDETGLACKMRPDTIIHPCADYPYGVVTDVKTAADASPDGFARSFFNLGYHIQAAHNAVGFMKAFFGDEMPTFWRDDSDVLCTNLPAFVFEVVEKDAPYVTQCYTVPPEVMEYGLRVRDELLAVAAECFESGEWPGYTQDVFSGLIVPGYIARQMEESGEIEVGYVEE